MQPTDNAIEKFQKWYKPVKWTKKRPLWPRRCFITGKWLWRDTHYRVEVIHLSFWWEMKDSKEYVWIDFETGTQIRLMF